MARLFSLAIFISTTPIWSRALLIPIPDCLTTYSDMPLDVF